MTFGTSWRAALGTLGLAVLAACGGGGDSPSGGTPPPSTQPTPAPTPTPPPVLQQRGLSCGLAYGDPTGDCARTGPAFQDQIEKAVDLTYGQHPEVFDLGDANGPGQYRIKSPGHYLQYLLANLESQGLCADYQGEEVQVKNSQAFHEQWDMMAGGYVRRGPSAYRATYTPAGFPIQEPPRQPVAGCRIGASRSLWCQRESSSLFIGAVLGAQQQVFREKPQLFDFNDLQRGTNWPKVLNTVAYEQAMVDILRAQGYCVVVDLELGIKNGNTVSENFDILTSGFYARGDDGSYRATCVPADF